MFTYIEREVFAFSFQKKVNAYRKVQATPETCQEEEEIFVHEHSFVLSIFGDARRVDPACISTT